MNPLFSAIASIVSNAEMPGFYRDDEYDLAGFAVGIVDRSEIIDKESVRAGDIVLALRSRSEERRVGKECRSRWSPYH